MKRLVISGLLSLAAVSCGGSSKVTAEDVSSAFCSATEATDAATAKSCWGAYWTAGSGKASKADCVTAVNLKTAAALSDLSTEDQKSESKVSDAYKALKDKAVFTDKDKALASCKVIDPDYAI